MTDHHSETALPTFAEISETLELLEVWEDRYRYIIELGQRLPPFSDRLKIPENQVTGCASQVWLYPQLVSETDGTTTLRFLADSDALIVKGLLVILLSLVSGQSPAKIRGINLQEKLDTLGLSTHLSRQRSNGLAAVAMRIQALALKIA